jgi:tetratricopeptide (TPR) repeat protein
LASIGARLREWQRWHPRLALGVLAGVAALLGGAGYVGGRHLWVRSHFRAAQQAFDRHDWAEAHKEVDVCLERWPNSPAVHLVAARIARRQDSLADAAKHLETCQRLQGGETQATKVEQALLQVYRGDLAGQEAFLRSCVEQDDPDVLEILDVLSAALILQSREAEAHRCLDDLLRRQPNHFDALVRRGYTAKSMAWYPQAVESLQKALELRPDVFAPRLSLAEILVVLGRFEEAQKHFELLREKQSRNPSVLFGLARCLAGRNQNEEAIGLLDRLLAVYPNDWKALSERGWLAVQLDRVSEGETYLRRAYSLAPPDLQLLVRLTDCLRLVGKQEEARTFREQMTRLKADIQRAGQLGDLIRDQNSNDPAPRYELACILLRTGKEKDALHWFQTALEKAPNHRPTHEALAAFFEKVGATEQAAQHRRILQKLESVR